MVKSSVIVGHDEDAEKEAKSDNKGKRPELCAGLVVEPESSMLNAADVILAMGLAARGSG